MLVCLCMYFGHIRMCAAYLHVSPSWLKFHCCMDTIWAPRIGMCVRKHKHAIFFGNALNVSKNFKEALLTSH